MPDKVTMITDAFIVSKEGVREFSFHLSLALTLVNWAGVRQVKSIDQLLGSQQSRGLSFSSFLAEHIGQGLISMYQIPPEGFLPTNNVILLHTTFVCLQLCNKLPALP